MTSPLRVYAARQVVTFLFVALTVLLGVPSTAFAGFGITPPYVKNDRLTRNMVYDQKITLVRSDPTEDLKAEITMNIPGAEEWFSVDKGKQFILPKGQTQVPIVISVRVPADAVYKEYKGTIRIRTTSAKVEKETSGVSIALGAQIDVDIKIVDKIFDFSVRRVRIADLEEGRTKWGLFFPGKMRFFMTIENTGNTDFGPTKVRFDIYDSEMETLLETTENTNKIESIPPFSIREVVAELPTRLPAGKYVAKYSIYKNEEIAQQNNINISISAAGAVIGYEGYGFSGLSLRDKIRAISMIGIPLALVIILIIILVSKRNVRRRSRETKGL